MQYCKKIVHVVAVAVILSILVIALPASPALAAEDINLDPDEVEIGDQVDIEADGFYESTASVDYFVNIYLSDEEADEGDEIDDEVENYEKLKSLLWIDEDGELSTSFDVPDELTDGEDDVAVTGGTYYVYVTYYDDEEIVAVAEFTITGAGEIEVDPDEGPVGIEVEIAGSGFPDDKDIAIEYDGDEVDIEDGDDETDGDGEFVSLILIPESTAGEHTITVNVDGNEAEIEFAVEPKIIVSPTSGEADTEVTLSGTGYGKRQDVVVYLDGDSVAAETTDSDGSFVATFTIPDLTASIYDIEAEDDDDNSDSAKFTILATTVEPVPQEPEPAPKPTEPPAPTTAINISTTTAKTGSDVVVTGAGFKAGGVITIELDGEAVTTAIAEPGGTFVTIFSVPVQPAGDYTMTITDGINTNELTFTIELEPPAAPMLLFPEMWSIVKTPVLFDWESIESGNPPVTYTLQIATDSKFPEKEIVMERKELSDSEYILTSEYVLTKEEAAKLNLYDTPLYWRVRVTDGNEVHGSWTGAGEFQVNKPFSMPAWVIFTLAGIAVIFTFLIGYWIGKRATQYH